MWQIEAPFIGWAFASILLGLGFTFFSGATEAWLVDALGATGFTGNLETVFGRGQTIGGVAMLTGSVLGGVVAQLTNLGVPYVLRAIMLGVALLAAFLFMHDLGFTPKTGVSTTDAVKDVARGSIDGGLRNRPVRWLMLAAPVHRRRRLLRLLRHAAVPARAVRRPDRLQHRRPGRRHRGRRPDRRRPVGAHRAALLQPAHQRPLPGRRAGVDHPRRASPWSASTRTAWAWAPSTWPSSLLVLWALVFAIAGPIRQAFLNGIIPSEQRATVLSFDSLMGSIGGMVAQPALGRVADVSGYAASYLVSGVVSALALPFVFLARREKAPSDPIDPDEPVSA